MRLRRESKRPAGIALLAALLLVGCGTMGPAPEVSLSPGVPSRVSLTAVPFFAQERFQCGPAALAMALRWSGVDATPDSIAETVFTPGQKGSYQSDLTAATRRHGRLAYPITGLDCLFKEVAAGYPVVVLQNLGLNWIPRWHYATVIGFDLDQSFVELHTGDQAARRVGLKTFAATWKRADYWGLLVLPPGRMPQCARETIYLKSVQGLYTAGFAAAAIDAFEQAVSVWPASAQATMALGNALYREGATQKAIQTYRRAVSIEPRNGDALNNLAHMLSEAGDLKAALSMAHRAVDAAGPRRAIYQQTLEEIRRKLPPANIE